MTTGYTDFEVIASGLKTVHADSIASGMPLSFGVLSSMEENARITHDTVMMRQIIQSYMPDTEQEITASGVCTGVYGRFEEIPNAVISGQVWAQSLGADPIDVHVVSTPTLPDLRHNQETLDDFLYVVSGEAGRHHSKFTVSTVSGLYNPVRLQPNAGKGQNHYVVLYAKANSDAGRLVVRHVSLWEKPRDYE